MTFNSVYNPNPKVEEISANRKKFVYYLRENQEEIYAIIIMDSNFDQNKIKIEISRYNKRYLQVENIIFFLKTLFYIILDLSFNRIEIVNFPINQYPMKYFFILNFYFFLLRHYPHLNYSLYLIFFKLREMSQLIHPDYLVMSMIGFFYFFFAVF